MQVIAVVIKQDGENNVADIGTKVLTAGRFQKLVDMLGRRNIDTENYRLEKAVTQNVGMISLTGSALTVDKKLLTALVFLVQALNGTNGEEIESSECSYSDTEDSRGMTSSVLLLLLGVFAVGMVVGCCLRGFWIPAPAERPVQRVILVKNPDDKEKDTKAKVMTVNAMTQSQCTYRWWWARPRFEVLHKSSQGAWRDW